MRLERARWPGKPSWNLGTQHGVGIVIREYEQPGSQTVNIRSFCLQLFCGAAGGYIAGAAFTILSWGAVGDLLIGIAGGGIGGQILEHLWAGDAYCSEMQIFLSSAMGGCVGGALMVVILGFMRAILRRR